jgi:hypothetical protein
MQFKSIPLACGLAFDIEKDEDAGDEREFTASGFKPARLDAGASKELFADLRLEGFAALLRLDFAQKLIVFGGDEKRYEGEKPIINRAESITKMLEYDYGIPPERLGYFASRSNTTGNVEAIKRQVGNKTEGLVVSNHYHIPRAHRILWKAGVNVHLLPAESFMLLEDRSRKESIFKRLGGGPLAERMVEEIQGIADDIIDAYVPRTDVVPTKHWWKKLKFFA